MTFIADEVYKFGNFKNDIFDFYTLYYDTAKNKRQWTIFIRLVELSKNDKKIINNNWNLEDETQLKLNKEWLIDNSLGEEKKSNKKIYAQCWTEAGIVESKILRYAPSYFGFKNMGKKNQTNPFQTAFIFAKNKYKIKMEKGGRQKNNINTATTTTTIIKKNTKKYFPMLVGKYEEGKTKLNYPICVQPKLDGIRCVAFLDLKNNLENLNFNNVNLYSRTLKSFSGHEHIRKSIFDVLYNFYMTNKEIIYLDGELYIHGKELQEIVSLVTNKKNQNENENEKIEYHLFDLFDPKNNEPFKKRMKILKTVYNKIQNKQFIKIVPNYKINNKEELFNKLENLLKEKYEGLIIRNLEEKYLTSNTNANSNIRSKKTLKLKKKITNEYEIVNFSEGEKGNSKGSIIWICKTKDGNLFKVTPKNMDFDERKRLFLDASKNFNSKYKGKMLTVEFDATSKKNIPLRAKALSIRDYE